MSASSGAEQSKSVGKGFAAERCGGIDNIREDPSRLDSMAVKDLRSLARDVGIPGKGTKKDLVAALKCFMLAPQNGDDMHSGTILVESKSIPTKRKAKPSSSEEGVEVSEIKQKRTRRKQQTVTTTTVVDDSRTITTKQELSVETEGVVVEVKGKVSDEPWTLLAHKKPQAGWVPYNPRTMRPPPLTRDENFVKLMSWNVNGLRALLKLESFSALQLAQSEDFDVLCLQETKIQEKDVEAIKKSLIDGFDNSFWTCSVSKLGYSGTAIISRIKPISVRYGLGIPDHDSEGRLITVEFDTFFLIGGYVPNSGDGLKRLTYRVKEWDPSLSNYMKELEKSKPVILTGDLNCCHQEIDIYDPAGNRRSAGFTSEERESFEMSFLSKGFVDTFRKQHPGVVGYTYWNYRHGARKLNRGWRLDYFLVSESIADNAYDSYILPQIAGSDHCPIGLVLKL